MKKNVYIVRTRTYYMTPLFLQSDWIIGRKWRLVIGSISSDMIGWCYKTFQSCFRLNKFILVPSDRACAYPNRPGEALRVTFEWIFRKEHELCYNDMYQKKQLTDILKRWISKVATFEKVRENSTGKKIRVKKSTGKKVRKKQIWGKK